MHNPSNVLFIKLGGKGSYEKECIEEKSTIKLGYNEINHELCLSGQWDDVMLDIQDKYRTAQIQTTSHKNQIKKFYKEPSTTMWITFYQSKMYYCYADTKLYINNDGTKERKTLSGWHDTDTQNNTLFIQFLSGRLTKVQGFRGTICDVLEKEYLLHKLNNTQSRELQLVEENLKALRQSIESLIKKLNPKDFEIFVDLIFRSAGWSRIGHLGKTIKDIDIQLLAPITNESAIVQVKSQSSLTLFNEYKNRFENFEEYDKIFYATHTPNTELQNYIDSNIENNIQIYDSKKLAELCINAGLLEWLINVAP